LSMLIGGAARWLIEAMACPAARGLDRVYPQTGGGPRAEIAVRRVLQPRRGPLGVSYCSPELDKLVNQQSMEANPQKRKDIVWQIERKLAEAAVRPVLFYPVGATCRQPWVKGLTIMTNSIYNEWRMEDVWLDK